MYNVMIVDDEEPVLDSFAYMIEKGSEDFTLCGKARSGNEALALVGTAHPDVVFMDIGMPGLDGLETIKELQKRYPEILFILSTAYERFDIAKKAIPLGVLSYLVKPISRRKFLETLDKAKEHLDRKRETMLSQLENVQKAAGSRSWEEKNFLSVIPWKRLEKKEWERYDGIFSFCSSRGAVLLLTAGPAESENFPGNRGESAGSRYVSAGDSGKYTRVGDQIPESSGSFTASSTSAESAAQDIFAQIITRLSHKYQVFSAEYSGKIMLLVMEDQNAERLDHAVRHAVQAVLPEQWTYTLGRGSFRPYHELYLSYNEALIPFDDQENYRDSQHQEDQMITQIRKSVSRNEPFAEILQDLETFLELLQQDDSLGLLKGKLTMLFSLLYDDLKHSMEKISPAEHGAQHPDPVRELVKLGSRTACEQWAVSTLRSIVETAKAYQHENRPLPLRKAVLFIDSHYHEPIQLSAAAEQCDVSPAYLSRLFSEHLHMSFVDYITHIRIRKAEEMLKKRAATVKETAYAVGYHDPNYFSKIFKKYTGRTPSSYS